MFKDHFSHSSKNYAKYRPGYPSGLFDFIISECSKTESCWDVGCGNGQASVELAKHFDQVLATDASQEQIKAAQLRDNITYLTAPAENCPSEDHSFDLVTVAQAIHWFDFDQFFEEVRRATRPGGLLAFWTYDLHKVDDQIDEVIYDFYENTVGEFWPPERKFVESHYQTIDVPFVELETPKFSIQKSFNRDDVVNYMSTWSAVKNYRNQKKEDPIVILEKNLRPVWPDRLQLKMVTWGLHMRLFKSD